MPRYRNVLSDEDYAVYAVVRADWDARALVSRDLVSAPYLPDPWWVSTDLPWAHAETLEDFRHVNTRRLQLEVAPLAGLPVVWTKDRELQGLEKRADPFRVWVPG